MMTVKKYTVVKKIVMVMYSIWKKVTLGDFKELGW